MIKSVDAIKAISIAEEKAKEFNLAITTCVVDRYGIIIATKKMDGARIVSPDFAYTKAYTSAVLQVPTSVITSADGPGKPFFGTKDIMGGKLTVLPGGIPIIKDNVLLGAVGVGGSSNLKEDEACAKAAAEKTNSIAA